MSRICQQLALTEAGTGWWR